MKPFVLTFLLIIFGLVSLCQNHIQADYKSASFRTEKFESPLALVSHKSEALKKSFMPKDFVPDSFFVSTERPNVLSFKFFAYDYYVPVYNLIHPKQFYLLI
jgi:hypothetical protein